MSPDQLLVIAKKMCVDAHIEDDMVWVEVDAERYGACYGEFSPNTCINDLLGIMCHFRIWIDDKPDGSMFEAYHFSGNVKVASEPRQGPATPEGIVDCVLNLAYILASKNAE